MTTTTVEAQPVLQCAVEGVDPEWWVHQHPGHCQRDCSHGLASHICLNHCAVVDLCQDWMETSGKDEFSGMVLGGLIKLGTVTGDKVLKVPITRRRTCSLCRIENK